jgi:hypothetical protein
MMMPFTARDVYEAHQQAEAKLWPYFKAKSWEKLLEADKAMYEHMAQWLNEKLEERGES